jgi:hypothetical protein
METVSNGTLGIGDSMQLSKEFSSNAGMLDENHGTSINADQKHTVPSASVKMRCASPWLQQHAPGFGHPAPGTLEAGAQAACWREACLLNALAVALQVRKHLSRQRHWCCCWA